MKNIILAICVPFITNFAFAQTAVIDNTVTSDIAKPIIHKLLTGATVKPFEKDITFEKETGNTFTIEIGDKKLAAQLKEPTMSDPENEANEIKGSIDIKKAVIIFSTNNFNSINDGDKLNIKVKGTMPEAILIGVLTKNKKEVKSVVTEPSKPNNNYILLIKKQKLSLNLTDLYPDTNGCCDDIPNPCDSGKDTDVYNKNKIIYDSKRNQTVYYNNKGTRKVIDYEDIIIRAGRPLAFEVRNVNPDAFKVEITDTAIAYEYRLDTLLSLLPGVSDNFFLAEAGGKEPVFTRLDSARAVLVVAYMNLKEFFLHLQNGCIYEFNKNIERKKEAKKRVDSYLSSNLNQNVNIGLSQTIINDLLSKDSKEDKELSDNLLALYKNLPSAFYRMITQIPSVPKDKDKIQFRFNILARENTPYMSLVKDKTIDAYIVKNFRVDVSTGLYYAFNIQNDKYVLRGDSVIGRNAANTLDSNTKVGNRIIKENIGKGEFGFASFIHFYKRCTPGFSWGGHIGAGISINDKIKPRYFGGLSFIFGRDNTRFAINAGYIGGNVETISDQYPKDSNGDFIWVPESEKNINTKTKFLVSPFVSISYNLPFRSKKKATQEVTPEVKK